MVFLWILTNFKTGVVLPRELKENPEYLKKIKIGDKIPVKILSLENEDGYVEISVKRSWFGTSLE